MNIEEAHLPIDTPGAVDFRFIRGADDHDASRPQTMEQLLALRAGKALAPARRASAVCPAEVEEYSAGLRRLSDRRREMACALEKVRSDIEELDATIAGATGLPAKFAELLLGHPFQDSKELSSAAFQYMDKYLSLLADWKPDADRTLSDLADDRGRLEKCIADMNAVALDAAVPRPAADAATTKLCPVCMERDVDTVLMPCGHTFCETCWGTSIRGRGACSMCRQPVQTKAKLFFSV